MNYTDEQDKFNELALEYVKQHIDYDVELMNLDDFNWDHVGYVGYDEVELSEYKDWFYPNLQYHFEKNNADILYKRQDADDDTDNYYELIYQTTGCCEDDFHGFCLFPLNDGRYWKISFYC